MRTHSISEGQAAARYMYDHFLDTVSGSYRSYIRDPFNDLDKRKEVPLLVIDIGSSGTIGYLETWYARLKIVNSDVYRQNIKLQFVSFDDFITLLYFISAYYVVDFSFLSF